MASLQFSANISEEKWYPGVLLNLSAGSSNIEVIT